MEVARARFLVSDRARVALSALDPALAALPPHQLADRLRRDWPPAEAAALAEQLSLRGRAFVRFGEDPGLRYTAAGLEMLAHPLLAARRARRLAALGLPVTDLTVGLGGDIRACLAAGLPCRGLERDYATAILAAANLPGAAVARGDASAPPFRLRDGVVLLDPSRRSVVGRRFDVQAFAPPWTVTLARLTEAIAGVLKAPPGVDHDRLPAACEVEFVQLGRSLREAVAWVGHGADPGLRRAVLLPAGAEIDSRAPAASASPGHVGSVVFDPESCVTRAGLVRHLAARLGAHLLDPQVAYLSGPPAVDPLASAFAVLDVMHFSLARLRGRLRERGWRPSEIRRRAFPLEPDDLRRLLGPQQGDPVTLLCTTLAGQRTVIVARPIARAADETA
ncbi:MAG: hypothetical protein IT304_00735 [Dehalococcoidia bacterium]|nr:hypothetical protein [Dehalococcoidia bacterium]